jgi:hypothetical protein
MAKKYMGILRCVFVIPIEPDEPPQFFKTEKTQEAAWVSDRNDILIGDDVNKGLDANNSTFLQGDYASNDNEFIQREAA